MSKLKAGDFCMVIGGSVESIIGKTCTLKERWGPASWVTEPKLIDFVDGMQVAPVDWTLMKLNDPDKDIVQEINEELGVSA